MNDYASPTRRRLRGALVGSAMVLLGIACHGWAPSNVPEAYCKKQCHEIAHDVCSARECGRGCSMLLDRIVEHESEVVMRCMARSSRGCSDTVWAECATRVGPYADGGPVPPPPAEFDDED